MPKFSANIIFGKSNISSIFVSNNAAFLHKAVPPAKTSNLRALGLPKAPCAH